MRTVVLVAVAAAMMFATASLVGAEEEPREVEVRRPVAAEGRPQDGEEMRRWPGRPEAAPPAGPPRAGFGRGPGFGPRPGGPAGPGPFGPRAEGAPRMGPGPRAETPRRPAAAPSPERPLPSPEAIFRRLDRDGDGKLSLAEFTAGFERLRALIERARPAAAPERPAWTPPRGWGRGAWAPSAEAAPRERVRPEARTEAPPPARRPRVDRPERTEDRPRPRLPRPQDEERPRRPDR